MLVTGSGAGTDWVQARPGRRSAGSERLRSLAVLAAFLGIGAVSVAVTFTAALGAALGWWPATPRVDWAPPVLVVATIRSVLYLAVSVAAWVVWTRRRRFAVHTGLGLFVCQQVLATIWPVLFFAGFGWLGLAGLWVTVGVLLVLDLLLTGTALAFWGVSRGAAVVVVLDLLLALFVTALVVGSAGQHAAF